MASTRITCWPNEVACTIEFWGRLCGIDLKKDHGTDLAMPCAAMTMKWLQEELFDRPIGQVRPILNVIPGWYKSYLAFRLYCAKEKVLQMDPEKPVGLKHGNEAIVQDVLAGEFEG